MTKPTALAKALADLIITVSKERDEIKDFAIWMTGCGYDFCQHAYFIKKRDELLKDETQYGNDEPET